MNATLDNLTSTMMRALGAMPVQCVQHGFFWCLPPFGPSGGTISALERRGLVYHNAHDHRWQRTALGESVWEHR